MSYVIVITGASSGFGALTARGLADAGHIVYASMRDAELLRRIGLEDLLSPRARVTG